MVNNDKKIEIKLESQSSYYFNLIRKNIIKGVQISLTILVIIATLYIGFYILLLFILLIGTSYLFRKFKQ